MARRLTVQEAARLAQNEKRYWAADVVTISQDGCVLFVERSKEPQKGFLALPGGMVRPDENYHRAAIRELEEETGRKLPEEMKPCAAGVFDKEGRDPRKVPIKSHAFCYILDRCANDMPVGGEENLKARWVPSKELKGVEFYADHREVLFGLLKAAADAVPKELTSFCAREIGAAVDHCVFSETEIVELMKATPDGPILCVDLILFSADEKFVLLMEGAEEPKLLAILGGIIKPTENPWETCLRKSREAGIVMDGIAERGALFFRKGERDGVGASTFVYRVVLKEKVGAMAPGANGATWLDVNELPADGFFADHRDMLIGCIEASERAAAARTVAI